MNFVELVRNKSFSIYRHIVMPLNIAKDLYAEGFVKAAVVKNVESILGVFKKMIDSEEIVEVYCYASAFLDEAKNNTGFLNEIFAVTGLQFDVLATSDELNYIYTAIMNTCSKPKGLIINVSNFTTSFLLYNRRNILNTKILPYGYQNLHEQFVESKQADALDKIAQFVGDAIKDDEWITSLQDDFEIVGCGNMFQNLGVISRKSRKYPVDIAHNYLLDKSNFDKVYGVLRAQDVTKTTKVKGITIEDSRYLQSAFAIMDGIMSRINIKSYSISRTGFVEGLLFNKVIPLTVEKPISDTLGYSLQVINDYYDKKPNNTLQVYDIAMILFKQLKVLHKLGRSYVKVLRIASYLCNAGLRTNWCNDEKIAFNSVIESEIYGVSHSEIVLAAFVVMTTNADNFNLSDWVKYKDLLKEEDMAVVKKLAVILRIAQSLDVTHFGNVVDINCDILGDSVIMKTVVNEPCDLEIKHAMLSANEFKKAFNKNLEIL